MADIFRKQRILLLLFSIALLLFILFFYPTIVNAIKPMHSDGKEFSEEQNENHDIFLPIILKQNSWTDCSQSGLGSVLISLQDYNDSTGPELKQLAQDGYVGLTGSTTYLPSVEYFPHLTDWDKAQLCNNLQCLQTRASNSERDGIAFRYLSYGPERLGGVPDEEKYNLPWATEQARLIADQAGKELIISYSTKQLHIEAEERGFGWDNPGEVVKLLAKYGDVWMIQAADEYNNPYSNPDHPDPILSQRHFPPGPEWRAEAEKWVNWIKAANPEIKIWIQLGLHRIGSQGEDNYPSSDLLLTYREWLVNPKYGSPLVDGVYITSIYSWPIDPIVADQEMVQSFHKACDPSSKTVDTNPSLEENSSIQAFNGISLVEEGWTDELVVGGITPLPGFYYRIYENSNYPCGADGNHQFMVLDHSTNTDDEKHLFAKFLGGAVGFWYLDNDDNKVYYPQENAVGLLYESLNRNWMFRTSVSEEYANGVTKRFRENENFRILVPSYCSHDFYHGQGEYNDIDGFGRYGNLAAKEAVEYVVDNFNTEGIITYGGSAGAASFFVGVDIDQVVGMIMDSQAADLTAISEGCYAGTDVFGGRYPCFCPEQGGPSCMEVLAPRIGFEMGWDEPYRWVERGEVSKPIYLVWNERDGSLHAHLQYDNLHNALEQYNPGGNSVANKVCIRDPESPPGPICNLHVPSAYDYPETFSLVQDIYHWSLSLFGYQLYQLYLPAISN